MAFFGFSLLEKFLVSVTYLDTTGSLSFLHPDFWPKAIYSLLLPLLWWATYSPLEKVVKITPQGRKVYHKAGLNFSDSQTVVSVFLTVWTKPPQSSVFILECVVQLKSSQTAAKVAVYSLGMSLKTRVPVYPYMSVSMWAKETLVVCFSIVLSGALPCSGCFQCDGDVMHDVAGLLVCTVTCHV